MSCSPHAKPRECAPAPPRPVATLLLLFSFVVYYWDSQRGVWALGNEKVPLEDKQFFDAIVSAAAKDSEQPGGDETPKDEAASGGARVPDTGNDVARESCGKVVKSCKRQQMRCFSAGFQSPLMTQVLKILDPELNFKPSQMTHLTSVSNPRVDTNAIVAVSGPVRRGVSERARRGRSGGCCQARQARICALPPPESLLSNVGRPVRHPPTRVACPPLLLTHVARSPGDRCCTSRECIAARNRRRLQGHTQPRQCEDGRHFPQTRRRRQVRSRMRACVRTLTCVAPLCELHELTTTHTAMPYRCCALGARGARALAPTAAASQDLASMRASTKPTLTRVSAPNSKPSWPRPAPKTKASTSF